MLYLTWHPALQLAWYDQHCCQGMLKKAHLSTVCSTVYCAHGASLTGTWSRRSGGIWHTQQHSIFVHQENKGICASWRQTRVG